MQKNTMKEIGNAIVKSIENMNESEQKEFNDVHYSIGYMSALLESQALNDSQKVAALRQIISFHCEQTGKGCLY